MFIVSACFTICIYVGLAAVYFSTALTSVCASLASLFCYLADRTNGRAYGKMLGPSIVCCL